MSDTTTAPQEGAQAPADADIRLPGIERPVRIRAFTRASAWMAMMRVAREAMAAEPVEAGPYAPTDDDRLMAHVLAATVVWADSGEAVQGGAAWDAWGAQHLAEFFSLYRDATRRNGADAKDARGN